MLTYPNVPNPSVVDVRFVDVTSPEPPPFMLEIYPRVPNPFTVEIKEDSKREVLTILESEDRYPKVPNPIVVDVRLVEVTSPLPAVDR